MFNEAERRIFGPYFNGVGLVFADPLRVHRLLHHCLDGEVNKQLALARSENEAERFQAWEKLIPATVYALDLKPFDPATGQGSLEQDVKAALRAYLEFMDEKKDQGLTSQTSLQPTPASVVSPSWPITAPTLPSGATLVGNNSAVPGQ